LPLNYQACSSLNKTTNQFGKKKIDVTRSEIKADDGWLYVSDKPTAIDLAG